MLIIEATLESFRSLKDKTINLQFGTQELTPEQIANVALNTHKLGFLVFSGDRLSDDQLKEIEKTKTDLHDNHKTPSQRLRNTLYIAWKQDNKGFNSFDNYYLYQMDVIINHYKSKLEPQFK